MSPLPLPPDSSPPPSLGSSFASLSLSSTSGVDFPSPAPSDNDNGPDSSDDEFIVLRRSASGTGYNTPLRAGLAASASSLAAAAAPPIEAAATETPRHVDEPEDAAGPDEVRDDHKDKSDDEEEGPRPARWADESEDELDTTQPLSPAVGSGASSPVVFDVRLPGSTDSAGQSSASSPSAAGPSAKRRRRSRSRRTKSRTAAHSFHGGSAGADASPFAASSSNSTSRSSSSRASITEARSSDARGALSDVCTDEAASAVLDQFFNHASILGRAGISAGGKLEKLRFWQSLIIELGILPAPDTPWSNLSSASDSESGGDDHSATSAASDRTATMSMPFPTTLTAAGRILRSRAHVNLVDYLALRERVAAATDADERAALRVEMQGLRKSSRTALKWYTIRSRKFVKRKLVKSQWLDPLLIDVL